MMEQKNKLIDSIVVNTLLIFYQIFLLKKHKKHLEMTLKKTLQENPTLYFYVKNYKKSRHLLKLQKI